MRRAKIFCIGLSLLFLSHAAFAKIPTPEEVLGFKIGTDRKVADMHQILDYFAKLDKASERIVVKELGKTTMGNPFIVAFITSAENHKNLKKYRTYQQLVLAVFFQVFMVFC